MKQFSTHTVGQKYTKDFSVYITCENKKISPFHAIDLYQNKSSDIVTVVNEIPRFENAKFEIVKDISLNPIKQDIKKGKLRYVANLYPFKGYMWNYGALPQTWEDKNFTCGYTNKKGDNDPLDVLDFSSIRKEVGEVYQAKVLGSLAMIDDDECDWKIIVIDIKDPLADVVNNEDDIRKHFPKYIENTIYWLKNYKVPDGKPVNVLGLHENFMDRRFTLEIIQGAHNFWKKLIEKKSEAEIKYDLEGEEVKSNSNDEKCDGYAEGYYFLNN